MTKFSKGSSGSPKHTEHVGTGEALTGAPPAQRGPVAHPGVLGSRVTSKVVSQVVAQKKMPRPRPAGGRGYDGEEG